MYLLIYLFIIFIFIHKRLILWKGAFNNKTMQVKFSGNLEIIESGMVAQISLLSQQFSVVTFSWYTIGCVRFLYQRNLIEFLTTGISKPALPYFSLQVNSKRHTCFLVLVMRCFFKIYFQDQLFSSTANDIMPYQARKRKNLRCICI